MNLNSQQSGLNSLHAAYNNCLSARFDAWMNSKGGEKETEWCAPEKKAYLDFMRDHLPTQYENLLRLEENNF